MRSSHSNFAVGLDVGQSTVKAVAVARRGKRARVMGVKLLDCKSEGLLDAAEVHGQLPGWLADAGWKDAELTVGLPQYLVTTQINDFPPGSKHALGNMVAYETQQLAGLSEESFIYDHCPLEPGFGWENPVFIGICRDSVVSEQANLYLSGGLRLADFGLSGLALIAAYRDLYPDATSDPNPQLLIDIGTESSTLVVLLQNQILFQSSLLFGSQRYTQALMQRLGANEEQADKAKEHSRLNASDTESPLVATTRFLEREIATALEHWRSQERAEVAGKMFGKVLLSGGGARLPGLAEYLGRSFGCPGEMIGFPMPGASRKKEAERDPRFLIAYGLALQGVGVSAAAVSLAPTEVSWLKMRLRNFRYLISAAAVFLAVTIAGFVWYHGKLTDESAKLSAEIHELEQCRSLIPNLERIMEDTAHREKILLPIVSKANRAQRFVDAIQTLSEAKGQNDWFVYVGDEGSYLAKYAKADERKKPTEEEAREAVFGPGGFGEGSVADIGVSTIPSEFTNGMLARDVKPLESLIVALYTPFQSGAPLKAVRDIVDSLNASAVFKDVDVAREKYDAGAKDIFDSWVDLFQDRRDLRLRAFILHTPFRTVDIVMKTIIDEKRREAQRKP